VARPGQLVGELTGRLADLVLPRVCAGCGHPGAVLCGACCTLLARPHVAAPRRHPPGFPPTVAAGVYAGPVRPAVVAFKERGRAELAVPLGTALALAAAAVLAGGPPGGGPVLLVPVPSSAAAVRRRGRDHVRELAGQAARTLSDAGVPAVVAPVLRRGRGTADSAGLDAGQRRANLAGRFRLAEPRAGWPAGARLVLVDDLVTSGATLTEAARALSARAGGPGGVPVLAAAVAATPRRPDPRAQAVPARSGEAVTSFAVRAARAGGPPR
jgi:predicted amidophosphoribosyltransferase